MNRIGQPWLTMVRLAWVILAGYNALPGLLGIPAYYQQLVELNPWPNNWQWTPELYGDAVRSSGLSPQGLAWIAMLPALVQIAVFLAVGLLVFWRKSDEWPGLLASFVLVGLCGTFIGDRFQMIDNLPPVWSLIGHEAGTLIWLAFFMFLTLFPDGRFVPAWTRWVAVILVPWYFAVEGTTLLLKETPAWIMLVGFVELGLILVGQVQRYRRFSNPAQRQQMHWFLYAVALIITYTSARYFFVNLYPLSSLPNMVRLLAYLVDIYLTDLVFLGLPVAIGIAVFRYRLWDVDLVIRRTLQYGLLTVLLALAYTGGVLVLQAAFRALSGETSDLALVISTLGIAVVFNPLRRQLQKLIDRRFFRASYNADQAAAAFSEAARRQVEPRALAEQLAAAAREILQPESTWVWIRRKTFH